MRSILSIQSHVAYGYVGNRAAVFPLQIMGFEVIAINTVQFSNHTGYGSWKGQIFEPGHIRDVIDGLRARGVLANIDAVLSGYLGDARLGAVILDTVAEIRKAKPEALYCCDPVMGDTGRGLFVAAGIPEFFRGQAVPAAGILTPNLFELAQLAGRAIGSREDAIAACHAIHDAGPHTVLVTSLETPETAKDTIEMMACTRDHGTWIVATPKLALTTPPNGAGDMTAALFTGHIVSGCDTAQALERTAASVYKVFETTAAAGQRELAMIAAQDCFRQPAANYRAQRVL